MIIYTYIQKRSSCRSKQLERTLQHIRTTNAAAAFPPTGSAGEKASQAEAATHSSASSEFAGHSDRPAASSAPLSETRELFSPYLADNEYLRRELSLLYDRCSDHLSFVNAVRPPRKSTALKLAFGSLFALDSLLYILCE